jgi:hypothetical protein
MGLDVCISPIKATIGTIQDYETETQYRSELEVMEKLVAVIKEKVKEQAGKNIVWNEEELQSDNDESLKEEGIEYFCERLGTYSLLHHLRRYAAHIDVKGEPPQEPCEVDEVNQDACLLKVYDNEVVTHFPHLIDHSDCDGYYIPCSFDTPIWINPSEIGMEEDHEDLTISVGSSEKLLKELEKINEYLKISPEETEDLEKFSEKLASDEWEFVKWSWAVLYNMCQQSLKFRQPIVFC